MSVVSVPRWLLSYLTEKHVSRYSRYLASKSTNVRVDETTELLGIWKSIQSKGYNWDKLNAAERREAIDAVEDEY